MAFGTPSNQKFSTLSSITGAGSTVAGMSLSANCAGNPGSPSNISLWDSFKGGGTISCSPTSGTSTEGEDFDVKIVPSTKGTYWDSRIGLLASNSSRGFNFSAAQTTGTDSSVSSSSSPRGDTKRYVFDIGNSETHPIPKITVTAQILETGGNKIGEWCGGDSNSTTCVVTLEEAFD